VYGIEYLPFVLKHIVKLELTQINETMAVSGELLPAETGYRRIYLFLMDLDRDKARDKDK
jgi:hypothetical protein